MKSKRTILVNIEIVRAFVQLGKIITSNEGLARKVTDLEKKYDSQFKIVFEAIKELILNEVQVER